MAELFTSSQLFYYEMFIYSFNSVLKIISKTAINTMHIAGKNYSFELDSDGHYNNLQQRLHWSLNSNSLLVYNKICTLRELIDIRDGRKKCNSLTDNDLDEFIASLSVYRLKHI